MHARNGLNTMKQKHKDLFQYHFDQAILQNCYDVSSFIFCARNALSTNVHSKLYFRVLTKTKIENGSHYVDTKISIHARNALNEWNVLDEWDNYV